MLKRIIQILSVICLAVNVIVPVYADNLEANISIDGVVTISGTSGLPEGTEVSVAMTYPRKKLTDAVENKSAEDGKSIFDIAAIIGQTTVTSDGTFNFIYKLTEDSVSGKYIVYAKVGISTGREETVCLYLNQKRHETAIEKILNTTENMKLLLDEYASDLDVDFGEKYYNYTDDEKSFAAGCVTSRTQFSDELKKAEEIISAYENIKLYDTEDAKNTFENYADELGVGSKDYAKYLNSSASVQNKIFTALHMALADTNAPSNIPAIFKNLIKKYIDTDSGGGGGGGSSRGNSNSSGFPTSVTSNYATDRFDLIQSDDGSGIFTDLKSCEWAQNAIETLYKKGIVSGRTKTEFCPLDKVTREEFVKMVVVAFEYYDDISDYSLVFKDTEKEQWYYEYIARAVKNGITEGISNAEFGVGMPVTRQDMAVILKRAVDKDNAVELYTVDDNFKFTDIDNVSDYAKETVSALGRAKTINGYGDGSFMPFENATRAEAVQMIFNMLYK